MSTQFVRRAGLKISGFLLSLLLFCAAGSLVASFVVGEPAAIKSIIAKSGAYDHLIDASLDTAGKAIKKESRDIPVNDPVIKEPLKEAYSPQVLQTNIEKLIDGVYRWLNGDVPQPDFVLDLGASNEVFIERAGDRLGERLRGLPPCTLQQLREQAEIDAFKATCIPPGVDISQLVQQAKASLRSNKELLPDQKITADTFKKEGESQNVFASANTVPDQFQTLKQTSWVLLIIIVLIGAAIILLSPSRAYGLRRLGKNLTITGLLILLIPIGLYVAQSALIDQKAVSSNQIAKEITFPLITELGKAVTKVYLIFGSLVVLVGGGMWFGSRKQLDKDKK